MGGWWWRFPSFPDIARVTSDQLENTYSKPRARARARSTSAELVLIPFYFKQMIVVFRYATTTCRATGELRACAWWQIRRSRGRESTGGFGGGLTDVADLKASSGELRPVMLARVRVCSPPFQRRPLGQLARVTIREAGRSRVWSYDSMIALSRLHQSRCEHRWLCLRALARAVAVK